MRVKSQKLLFLIFAIITVTAAVMLSIFLLNAEEKTPTASEATKKSLLFVYDGENAELKPVGDSGTEFTLSVPIASDDSHVTWFTDRPNRDAGTISYESFVKLFDSDANDSFKVDPPNVAIQIGSETLIAVMTKPRLITGAKNERSLVANFVLVPVADKRAFESETSFIKSHVSRSYGVESVVNARTLKRVSVFVDNVPPTCATGGICVVGDTGPGGGSVFYVNTGGFACGPTLAATCNYLEAAPTSGASAWTDMFYIWSGNLFGEIGVTAQRTAIGSGYANTLAMVGQSGGGNTPGRAGTIARAYRGPNNLSDWFLPSRDELNQVFNWGIAVGLPFSLPYWSSSEIGATYATIQFEVDVPGLGNKGLNGYVRPVRAF
jgi:hypothetical protein